MLVLIFLFNHTSRSSSNFLNVIARYGSWAVCFTYGTWFGIKGLVAAGRSFSNCSSIRKACDFLLSKQVSSGGWGESYLSCQNKVKYIKFLLHNLCNVKLVKIVICLPYLIFYCFST